MRFTRTRAAVAALCAVAGLAELLQRAVQNAVLQGAAQAHALGLVALLHQCRCGRGGQCSGDGGG